MQDSSWCPHFDQSVEDANCSICGRGVKAPRRTQERPYSPLRWLVDPSRPQTGQLYTWNPWTQVLTTDLVPPDAAMVHICGAIASRHVEALILSRPRLTVIEVAPSQASGFITLWLNWLAQKGIGLAVATLNDR